MQNLTYYWVNVFTTKQDQGTPLPVVILDHPLSTQSMQSIAKMFNQAETIFIEQLDSDKPLLHIYTPMQQLPFAGHPIIGALAILQKLRKNTQLTAVRCQSGIVETEIDHDTGIYWIKAPISPTQRASALDIATTSQMLGISPEAILHAPIWMNAGSEQLIVQLKDSATIDSVKIDLPLFEQYATLYPGRSMIYLWSKEDQHIYARYFYLKNGALGEDSGTGSAAANLGGYQLLKQHKNFQWKIQQGTLLQQESILYLKVQEDHSIWIGGENRYMGQGILEWQD